MPEGQAVQKKQAELLRKGHDNLMHYSTCQKAFFSVYLHNFRSVSKAFVLREVLRASRNDRKGEE